jgi:hypothetical protein
MASKNYFAIIWIRRDSIYPGFQGNREGMKTLMADFLVGNTTYENRMIIVQYFFIVTLIYLAVIIIIVGIGQRTRILKPSTQYKTGLIQWEGNRTVSCLCKTGSGSGQHIIKKQAIEDCNGNTRASMMLYKDKGVSRRRIG